MSLVFQKVIQSVLSQTFNKMAIIGQGVSQEKVQYPWEVKKIRKVAVVKGDDVVEGYKKIRNLQKRRE